MELSSQVTHFLQTLRTSRSAHPRLLHLGGVYTFVMVETLWQFLVNATMDAISEGPLPSRILWTQTWPQETSLCASSCPCLGVNTNGSCRVSVRTSALFHVDGNYLTDSAANISQSVPISGMSSQVAGQRSYSTSGRLVSFRA